MKVVPSIILIASTLFAKPIQAQIPTTFELGLQYTPAMSTAYGEHPSFSNLSPILTQSGGLKFNILASRYIINLGILFQTQGFKAPYSGGKIAHGSSVSSLYQTGTTGAFHSAKSTYSQLVFPALINYIYYSNDKINLYAGAGWYFGVTYKEEVKASGELGNTKVRSTRISNYFAMNTGAGIKLKVKPNMNIDLRLNMINQITNLNAFSNQAHSLGLDLGVNYVLTDKK